jgi:hypothetical protein
MKSIVELSALITQFTELVGCFRSEASVVVPQRPLECTLCNIQLAKLDRAKALV